VSYKGYLKSESQDRDYGKLEIVTNVTYSFFCFFGSEPFKP
jgi:hypothetical protein